MGRARRTLDGGLACIAAALRSHAVRRGSRSGARCRADPGHGAGGSVAGRLLLRDRFLAAFRGAAALRLRVAPARSDCRAVAHDQAQPLRGQHPHQGTGHARSRHTSTRTSRTFTSRASRSAPRGSPVYPVAQVNGGLQFIKGSHRWGKRYRPNHFVTDLPMDGTDGEVVPDFHADRRDRVILQFDMQPGDLTVHHCRTLHGAPANASPTIAVAPFRFATAAPTRATGSVEACRRSRTTRP